LEVFGREKDKMSDGMGGLDSKINFDSSREIQLLGFENEFNVGFLAVLDWPA
jgi:hypothetical protein